MTRCAWIRLGYVISGAIDAYMLAERTKRTWAYFDDPLQIFMTLHLALMAAIFITWAFLVLHPARRFFRYFLHFRIIFIVLRLTGNCQVVSFCKCHFSTRSCWPILWMPWTILRHFPPISHTLLLCVHVQQCGGDVWINHQQARLRSKIPRTFDLDAGVRSRALEMICMCVCACGCAQ